MSTLTGITSFKANMQKLADAVGVEVEKARRKIALDLYAGVRQRTPVKTGRARSNWDITVGSPSQRVDEAPQGNKDEFVTTPPMPAEEELGDTQGQSIYITNNLSYIEPLEHGHSKQAPAGMVAPTLAATEARVQAAIATKDE